MIPLSAMHPFPTYNWDKEFESYSIYSKNSYSNAFKSIKSYIEADSPELLSELLKNNAKAKIYSMMQCISLIPSVKCVEYLASVGTPLNIAFDTNPLGNIDVIEYINRVYSTPTKTNIRCKALVMDAINKGLSKINNLPKT
jgi:hypothetical protein